MRFFSLLTLLLLVLPTLPGQSYLLVNGADGSVTRYLTEKEMATGFECARGDLAFREDIAFDPVKRIPVSVFLALAPQVTFGGGSVVGGGTVPGPGDPVAAADFTSTADEACLNAPYPSLREDVDGSGTAWRCYAPVDKVLTQ